MCSSNPKKNEVKPWLKKSWVIPPKQDAKFVMRMEDILDLYKQPYDAKYPVVCFDTTNKQLTKELRTPLPLKPGHPQKYDYSYERNGVANVFLAFEPLTGTRYVYSRPTKKKQDFAEALKMMVDQFWPEAIKIRLVHDNYSSHQFYSLYEFYEPVEARRILEKIESHPTPEHASWLNMAEAEFSVLSRQVLKQRIGTPEELDEKLEDWQNDRNDRFKVMDWQFVCDDARIKLKKLYPTISC